MFWIFVQKVERVKQLYFGKFDEGFYGFARETFHFAVDSKILDFKTWAFGCLKDSLETLVRHIYLHFFRFFMHLFGWPLIQYKISLTDIIWSPTERPLIQLWKVNSNGFPRLPIGVLSFIPYCRILGHDAIRLVEREKFINARLTKYMEF
jgi:hypothetical protein